MNAIVIGQSSPRKYHELISLAFILIFLWNHLFSYACNDITSPITFSPPSPRHSDPNSGGSSFSILLGDAPHLDGQYAVFGRLTKGDDTLRKLEQLPTRREGIFVMPIERISILSTYYYDVDLESCEAEKSILRRRLSESASEVERWRRKCFAWCWSYVRTGSSFSLTWLLRPEYWKHGEGTPGMEFVCCVHLS
jgi:hypothetical protein